MNTTTKDPFDDRVVCTDCRFLVADRRCRNWRTARLDSPEVWPIKQMAQRCPGFAPHPQAQSPPRPPPAPTPTETRPNP